MRRGVIKNEIFLTEQEQEQQDVIFYSKIQFGIQVFTTLHQFASIYVITTYIRTLMAKLLQCAAKHHATAYHYIQNTRGFVACSNFKIVTVQNRKHHSYRL